MKCGFFDTHLSLVLPLPGTCLWGADVLRQMPTHHLACSELELGENQGHIECYLHTVTFKGWAICQGLILSWRPLSQSDPHVSTSVRQSRPLPLDLEHRYPGIIMFGLCIFIMDCVGTLFFSTWGFHLNGWRRPRKKARPKHSSKNLSFIMSSLTPFPYDINHNVSVII